MANIWLISDIHCDYGANYQIIKNLSPTLYREDILLVAGDVAHRYALVIDVLSILREKYRQVFLVPGNHDLWILENEFRDSLEKALRLKEDLRKIDVCMEPSLIDDCFCIVPVLSWYEHDFADPRDKADQSLNNWVDSIACRWPGDASQHACDLLMNENKTPKGPLSDITVVSMSHFVPRRDLLPPQQYLKFKGLPFVAGSIKIEQYLRRIGSACHVFGHSHINVDRTIDGVRYVQNSLGYPGEGRKSRNAPLLRVF